VYLWGGCASHKKKTPPHIPFTTEILKDQTLWLGEIFGIVWKQETRTDPKTKWGYIMDALEAIRKRRSVRDFTGDPIPREDLEKIVDAGRLAATGYNRQYGVLKVP